MLVKTWAATLSLMTALVLALVLIFSMFAQANSVGFSYSQAVDDTSWGVHGDYEKDLGVVDFELEGQIQSGDVYVGNVDVDMTYGFIRLSSNNNLKGYELSTLGRENVLSLSAVLPVLEDYEISVGVFGRNGNPFAVHPLYDRLVTDGYTDEDLVLLGVDNAGIQMPEGSMWGVSVTGGFDVAMFEIDVQLLVDPKNVLHQGNLNIGTGGELFGNFDWIAKTDIILQSYDEIIQWQNSSIIGVEYNF